MADNVSTTPGTIATDDISGVHYQRIKVGLGADGTAVDAVGGAGAVTTGTQRVTLASDDPLVAFVKPGTATRSSVTSTITSTTIMALNTSRKGGIICNTDANALYLDLSGGTAATTRFQVKLTTDQTYEVPAGYTGLITGIWSTAGSGRADVVEFT